MMTGNRMFPILTSNEKQKSNERKAALEREDRAARREMLGIEEAEVPASQVGNRRYARGRAYDPDRFGKQEEPVNANTDPEKSEPAPDNSAEVSAEDTNE